MKKKIKLFDPNIGKDEKQKISQVLESKFWASGSGTGNVLKFENQFKRYLGSDDCIAVNSGTSALNLSLSLFKTLPESSTQWSLIIAPLDAFR